MAEKVKKKKWSQKLSRENNINEGRKRLWSYCLGMVLNDLQSLTEVLWL